MTRRETQTPILRLKHPRLADAAVFALWGTWAVLLCIVPLKYDPVGPPSLIDPHVIVIYGSLLAGLLGPVWAFARTDRVIRRVASPALRQELALTTTSAAEFLYFQLRHPLFAALAPLLLPVIAVSAYVLVSILCRLYLHNWNSLPDFTIEYATFAGLLTANVLVTAAGLGWLFRARAAGAGSAGIAGRIAITLIAAYLGVPILGFTLNYQVFGTSGIPLAIAAILFLFVAAGQLHEWKVPRRLITLRETPARPSYGMLAAALALSAGTVALWFQLFAEWDSLLSWRSEIRTRFPVLLYVFLAAATIGVVGRFCLPLWDSTRIWPYGVIGILAVGGGTYLSRIRAEHGWIDHFAEGISHTHWRWTAAAVPAASFALLVARRDTSRGKRDNLLALLWLLGGTTAGFWLGLALHYYRNASTARLGPISFESLIPLMLFLTALISAGLLAALARRTARKGGDRGPQLTALCYGLAMLLMLTWRFWIPNWPARRADLISTVGCTVVLSAALATWMWKRAAAAYYEGL